MTTFSNEDLAAAMRLADKLSSYREKEEAEHFPALAQRAQQLEQALRNRLNVIANPTPRIAFVAHKGVGKSTLINALAGLWLGDVPPQPDATAKQLIQAAILPLGNGGTTPCEIRVETGSWDVRVEAEEPAETEARIKQFAEWAWHKAHDAKKPPVEPSPPKDAQEQDEAPVGIRPPRLQLDIERVVRGITGLKEHTTLVSSAPGVKPFPVRHDDAEELATGYAADKTEFIKEIQKRARITERQRSQWLPTGDARRWLRETLLNLIEGKFTDQPFPRCVIIRVPSTGVQWGHSDLPLIDTLGLPAVGAAKGESEPGARSAHPLAEREDLRELLKAPWTAIVVGAQFNEPPSPSVELLQQMMEESIYFGETLADRTAVVIVDPGMAGSGNFDDAETERAQKEDRCAENLVQLGCPRGLSHSHRWAVDDARERVVCVNILDGGREPLQRLLVATVARMVAAHEARLSVAITEAESFFRNLKDARHQAVQQDVVAAFNRFLTVVALKQLGKSRVFRSNLLCPFSEECRALHPSTLRSVIVNRGSGRSQNAWALLESATIRELGRILGPFREQIGVTSAALLSDKKYQDEVGCAVIAEEVDRRERTIDAFLTSFIKELRVISKKLLLADTSLWMECAAEWGTGIKDPGYKQRVANRFTQWGVDSSPLILGELFETVEQANADDSGILRALIEG